jgi:hypothetical protein
MTRLNWEKQNRAELPKLKRRESQRTKILKAYENGAKREREHIVRLLEQEIDLYGRDCWKDAVDLIKGDKR